MESPVRRREPGAKTLLQSSSTPKSRGKCQNPQGMATDTQPLSWGKFRPLQAAESGSAVWSDRIYALARWRISQSAAVAAAMIGRMTLTLRICQPKALKTAPEARAVKAVVPKTMNSLKACTLDCSSGR